MVPVISEFKEKITSPVLFNQLTGDDVPTPGNFHPILLHEKIVFEIPGDGNPLNLQNMVVLQGRLGSTVIALPDHSLLAEISLAALWLWDKESFPGVESSALKNILIDKFGVRPFFPQEAYPEEAYKRLQDLVFDGFGFETQKHYLLELPFQTLVEFQNLAARLQVTIASPKVDDTYDKLDFHHPECISDYAERKAAGEFALGISKELWQVMRNQEDCDTAAANLYSLCGRTTGALVTGAIQDWRWFFINCSRFFSSDLKIAAIKMLDFFKEGDDAEHFERFYVENGEIHFEVETAVTSLQGEEHEVWKITSLGVHLVLCCVRFLALVRVLFRRQHQSA